VISVWVIPREQKWVNFGERRGHAVVSEISRRFRADPVFSKASLWYARFRQTIPDFPRGTWSTYSLWQFSSEINCTPARPSDCLFRVPGTQTDMDINVFNGSAEELKSRWPFGQP